MRINSDDTQTVVWYRHPCHLIHGY